MHTYIALLRGINVSGKNKLPMAALKTLCNDLGYTYVQTYIQSGNIILKTTQPAATIAQNITAAIQKTYGYEVPTLVKPASLIHQVVANNPFQDQDLKTIHVTLLSSDQHTLTDGTNEADQWIVKGEVIYIHCPNGYGRTKLNNSFFEKHTGLAATTRNWNTICQLAAMTDNMEA